MTGSLLKWHAKEPQVGCDIQFGDHFAFSEQAAAVSD